MERNDIRGTLLGQDVRITVKPTRKARGEMAAVAG